MRVISSNPASLGDALVDAWRSGERIATPAPDQVPADAAGACSIQHRLIAACGGTIAAWKVGAKSSDGPIQGAPLPSASCHASGVALPRSRYRPLGLELEIGFRFGRRFAAHSAPYAEETVWAALSEMAATIEIVSSRFHDWPEVPRLAQPADLQNHGALIVGAAVPYRADFPFAQPVLRWRCGDTPSAEPPDAANPAGDPRRLLPWLVNHCTQTCGLDLTPDMLITTGSYTGMVFMAHGGAVVGDIDGLPPVRLTLR